MTNLPLSGHIAIASGNTEEEGVVGGKDIWRDDRELWLRGSMHLGEDVLWQRLGDPLESSEATYTIRERRSNALVNVDFSSSLLYASLLRFSH